MFGFFFPKFFHFVEIRPIDGTLAKHFHSSAREREKEKKDREGGKEGGEKMWVQNGRGMESESENGRTGVGTEEEIEGNVKDKDVWCEMDKRGWGRKVRKMGEWRV